MRELCINYKVMLKLSKITQLAFFALNNSICILNQNIKIMSTFKHKYKRLNIKGEKYDIFHSH
jgi:hypothetical protein